MLPDAYGCVVTNRFGDLLDDDADPFDLLNEAETEKGKKKKEELKKVKQKKPGQRESQKERRVPDPGPPIGKKHPERGPVSNESRGGAVEGQRGTRRPVYEERRADPEEQPPENYFPRSTYNADFDTRGQAGFRANFRGGRGGRGSGYSRNPENFNLRGKREYERQSGTGISPEEKRGGRGSWNWGSIQDTIGDVMEVTPDPSAKPEAQSPADGDEQASDVDGEVVVQVAMEMSLDEWKALQETSRSKAELNLRKADTEVPSKARVIHQSKQREDSKEDPMDMEDGHTLRRPVNDITSRLEINFGSLGRPVRGGRSRGRRDAPASGPENVQPISERVDVLAPNPNDPEDFPALTAGK